LTSCAAPLPTRHSRPTRRLLFPTESRFRKSQLTGGHRFSHFANKSIRVVSYGRDAHDALRGVRSGCQMAP
jgi:hypothetical protein